MAYSQAPDFFDEWPVAQVEREIEIYSAIREDGDIPLQQGVFVEFMLAAFGGK